ncbi:Protein of unknown function [Lactobacillus helveticus CIRM-BIA 104]|uniref:Uncharacterized protein n=1 Tax=Lactobacillus helveticus CIRM-BIA 104 TaxID=1226333 RepID=U6FDP1_LACHE|nr:Protein of unknown function [Lactobacillus helveticus CIRM-BIA 104]CDI63075.1 Protein of unknown function [Lactobacillus helveticus CIRM-BIA 103]
MTKIRGISPY